MSQLTGLDSLQDPVLRSLLKQINDRLVELQGNMDVLVQNRSQIIESGTGIPWIVAPSEPTIPAGPQFWFKPLGSGAMQLCASMDHSTLGRAWQWIGETA